MIAAGAAMATASLTAATQFPSRTDFRDESIYFVMTTRFYDGDPGNNVYCWDGNLNQKDPEWRGDFKGLIKKLDYIKALGFTSVWITPVVENASGLDYHGYHAMNFNKVDSRYESEDCSFQDLIDEAHKRGMKITLDIVLNHTGNFGEDKLCPMFVKDYNVNLSNLCKSFKLHPNTVLPADYDFDAKNAYDLRINALKNEDGVNHDTHNYYHHVATAWNWDDPSRWYAQIAGDCVDLNTENPAVSNYLVDCYGKFIKMGVDGFRIDTSGHISRLTFNKAFIPQFLKIAEESKAARNGGDFFMYGEVCARDRNVTYRGKDVLSPYFYTWKESKDYAWDYSETSWDSQVIINHERGTHTNILSQDKQGADYDGQGAAEFNSTNAFLNGNTYHAPDYTKYSGFSVIDFPMHWNFASTREAWSVRGGDKYYNDATWNVTYVDSHDYAPDGAPESQRFSKGENVWASNLDLMFTFRGIPCLYYGSEVEFKKGCLIDKGADLALKDSGRAYFGGYIEGDVTVTDFAEWTGATGNINATLNHPLALHIQRLNQIRAAIPALRKGQYSTDGCSGGGHDGIAFKRRYTDATTDSYVLVCIGGAATFTGVENGTYKDAITGDVQTVSNGTLKTKACSGDANMRVYVLDTAKTPAPGKIGKDGKYLYDTAPATTTQPAYDGNQEPEDLVTVRDGEDPEPPTPIDPEDLVRYEGEQCAFFHSTSGWTGVKAWVWSTGKNYTGGTWPGESCQNLGGGYYKWTYSGTDQLPEGTQIIFSGSGGQIPDSKWVNGAVYDASGNIEKIIEEEGENPNPPTPPTPPDPVDGTVVYYDNSTTNWSQPYIYFWSDADSKMSTWPGVEMQVYNASKKIWMYELPEDAQYIIFNNGNGNQTDDLDANFGHIYDFSGDQGVFYNDTAVDFIGVDNDAPLYFNLQGMPVENPSTGIYIVKRGNKVSKEYVR